MYARHRQRRRRGPVGPALRAERSERARRRHVEAPDQRKRSHHHAVQRHGRQGDGTLPRQAEDRHHRSRHRPDLRGQDQPRRHPGPGPVRRVDPDPEGRGGARRQEPDPHQALQPPRDRRRPGGRGAAGLRRADQAVRRRHRAGPQPGAGRRQGGPLRGRPGHAAGHRPRHVSVRDLVQPDRGRRLHRRGRGTDEDQPGHRHPQGVHDPRRLGPVPDRAAGRGRRGAAPGSAASGA